MKTLLKVFVFFILCIWVMKSFAEDRPFLIINENFWSLVNNSEAHCLALNIYHESRGDSLAGKFAVADVVLNRVENRRWPSTICEVVYQGKVKPSWKDPERTVPVRNMCQFSWWCDGQKDIIWATYMSGEVIPENMTAWRDSIHVALFIMNGDYGMDPTDGAVFYYNPHIANPNWGLIYTETAMIGNHRFMRDQ